MSKTIAKWLSGIFKRQKRKVKVLVNGKWYYASDAFEETHRKIQENLKRKIK